MIGICMFGNTEEVWAPCHVRNIYMYPGRKVSKIYMWEVTYGVFGKCVFTKPPAPILPQHLEKWCCITAISITVTELPAKADIIILSQHQRMEAYYLCDLPDKSSLLFIRKFLWPILTPTFLKYTKHWPDSLKGLYRI